MAVNKVASLLAGALLGVACFAADAQASEDDPAFYVGVGAGESRHALDKSYYHDDRFRQPETDLHQSRSSYLVYAGYRANPYLAIEADLQDLGGSDQWHDRCPAGIACPASVDFAPFRIHQSTRRATFAFVAILPLANRFELFAKLGLVRSRHSTDILHDPGLSNMHGTRSYTTDRLVSAGATYLFNADWALRLQWDRAEAPFRSVWYRGTTPIDAVSLALEHRFN